MLSILSTRRLEAGGAYGAARHLNGPAFPQPSVCFSEIPLDHLRRLVERRSRFGIGFDQRRLIAGGGARVWYVDSDSAPAAAIRKLIRSRTGPPMKTGDPLWEVTPSGQGDRWYGWQMVPGYAGDRYAPYFPPIYLRVAEPRKMGRRSLRLDFWNAQYAEGAQEFSLELRILVRPANYIVGRIEDEQAVPPERVALVSHIEFEWIRSCCPTLLAERPPQMFGSVEQRSVEHYLDSLFNMSEPRGAHE